jgi:hypothetical protein
MGGLTLADRSTIDKHCGFPGDPNGCDDTGLAAATESKARGLVSTVGFAAGGAAVVTAVVLLLTEPKRGASAPQGARVTVLSASRQGGTVGFAGAW